MVNVKKNGNAAMIGIIGGTDGPTAVYVTKNRTAPYVSRGMCRFLVGASFAAAALIAVARLAGIRRRRAGREYAVKDGENV